MEMEDNLASTMRERGSNLYFYERSGRDDWI